MLQLIGETQCHKASAAKILALEIKMSNPRLDRVDAEMVGCNTTDDHCWITKMTPAINWKDYFAVLVLQNWIP
jgi:endothelin-converting enzyme/putative endopeptidase